LTRPYLLEAAGTSRAKVINETIYLVGYEPEKASELIGALTAARPAGSIPPASTVVGVRTLFAEGLEHPRQLLVLENGDVLLSEQEPGHVTFLRDENGDPEVVQIPLPFHPALSSSIRPSTFLGKSPDG
jgi:glucose/arabinose dehydrogenase